MLIINMFKNDRHVKLYLKENLVVEYDVMYSKISKYTLWLGIVASLVMVGSRLIPMYESSTLLNELLPIAFSTLIICSPYIFMLLRLTRIKKSRMSQLSHLIVSSLITVSGVSLIFVLFYILPPDGQSAILIFLLVFLQWLVCIVKYIMESIISKKQFR